MAYSYDNVAMRELPRNFKSGMSLISAIIGLAILGALMVGLTKFATQSSLQRLANDQHSEVDQMRSLAKNIVRASPGCGLPAAGAGAVLNSAQIAFSGTNSSTIVPVATLGANQLSSTTQFRSIQMLGMELRNINRPLGQLNGTAELRLNAQERIKTGSTQDVSQSIPILLRFSSASAPSATITDCFEDTGDVVGATTNYLDNNLVSQVSSNFAQIIQDQLENNPQVLASIADNPVVRQSVCSGIAGGTWDEAAGTCTIVNNTTTVIDPGPPADPGVPSGPTPAGCTQVELVAQRSVCFPVALANVYRMKNGNQGIIEDRIKCASAINACQAQGGRVSEQDAIGASLESLQIRDQDGQTCTGSGNKRKCTPKYSWRDIEGKKKQEVRCMVAKCS